jgi:hypothetical protein
MSPLNITDLTLFLPARGVYGAFAALRRIFAVQLHNNYALLYAITYMSMTVVLPAQSSITTPTTITVCKTTAN